MGQNREEPGFTAVDLPSVTMMKSSIVCSALLLVTLSLVSATEMGETRSPWRWNENEHGMSWRQTDQQNQRNRQPWYACPCSRHTGDGSTSRCTKTKHQHLRKQTKRTTR